MPGITATNPMFATNISRTAWRRLRQMRSNPPGEAAKPPRRAVFSAALEQAEQLFSGAASADYMIKPILVFYGFNQACRALAACSTQLNDETFRPLGHGLSAPDTQGQLPDLKLTPAQPSRKRKRPQDSMLATLQAVLGSPSWSDSFTLGQLWSANPDLAKVPLPDNPYPEALRVNIGIGQGFDTLTVALSQVSSRLFAGADESDIQELLKSSYPELADSLPPESRDFAGLDTTIDLAHDKVNIYRLLPWKWGHEGRDVPRDIREVFDRVGMSRDNEHWLIPKLGGSPTPPHILVLWWALLFALSMRARYDPEGWTTDLDPDQGASAVVLETMLDMSMGICPELIVETMPSV
jgi:hypothetical protein